jgi:PEP-CTERM motif
VNASLVTGLNYPEGIVVVVPEPSTLALAAVGFAALVAWRWRQR